MIYLTSMYLPTLWYVTMKKSHSMHSGRISYFKCKREIHAKNRITWVCQKKLTAKIKKILNPKSIFLSYLIIMQNRLFMCKMFFFKFVLATAIL